MNRLYIFLVILISGCNALAQDTTKISLLFVGDIMQHDSQIRAALSTTTNSYDYTSCFQYVKPIVSTADLAFANLEVTLAGPPYKGYPQFSAPDELAVGLKEAGFDILVSANNHSLDRRRKGLERTIDVLDSLNIQHTGTFKDSSSRTQVYPLVIESNDFRFSLLNYTYGTNGIPVAKPNVINLIDTVQIKIDLMKASQQQSDLIIVFMHWGAEYKDLPNKTQTDVAEFCFRNGATLVVGSHPHVLQPITWNREENHLVAYSLGNFVSGQQSRYRDGGAMLWVELEKITLNDSINQTRIKEAAYDLAWVYRNNEVPKKYFILPTKEFESDTLLLKNRTAAQNHKTFVEDSRKLFKRNMNVAESERPLLESQFFKIWLTTTSSKDSIQSNPTIDFYGLDSEHHDRKEIDWLAGKFYDKDLANSALEEIISKTSYKEAKIAQYYWGKRIN